MRAIVTGASGFIGSQVVQLLTASGYEVVSVGRSVLADLPKPKQLMLEKSVYIQADLDNPDKLLESLLALHFLNGQLDFFFHFAWGGENRLSDTSVAAQTVNVERTIAMYELSCRLKFSRFIFCGSMEEAFAEKYTKLNYQVESKYNRHVVYALAKIAARKALKLLYSPNGSDIIFGTNSHVMGPGDDKDSFLQVALLKILSGDEINMSSGEQTFDVIDVRDCAAAYIEVARKGKNGKSYWIGSGAPRPLRSYVEEMNSLFPSVPINFGSAPYNDVILEIDVFSIRDLVSDAGFKPMFGFSDSVHYLAKSLGER